MDNRNLEVFLHESCTGRSSSLDRQPLIYMSYEFCSGGGTVYLDRVDGEIEEIGTGIVRKLSSIRVPEGTKIRFWNGEKAQLRIRPGDAVLPPSAGKLDDSKYSAILSYLGTKHPRISFERK